jgi:hypothetical protein
VAAQGLPGTEGREPVEVRREAWPALLAALARQRLTGLAAAAVRAGTLVLGDREQAELSARHQQAMAAVLMLEHLLLTVTEAMGAGGVQAVVLKGAALAHCFYPHPSWRSYGDLDLLVPTPQWRAACAVLAGLGFRRRIPEPRPGFDERFGKGAAHEDARGIQVDLHRTLALGPFGLWIDTEELLEGVTGFPFRGASLHRLDDTLSLVHACLHAALGHPEPLLLPLRDVLQVAWSGRVDWDELGRRARRWRLRGPVARALQVASRTLDADLPAEAAALLSERLTLVERRALAAYTTERAGRGGTALATLWAIPGVRARAAYVRALLFPARPFLAYRDAGGAGGTYRRRLMVPVRWVAARVLPRRRSASR